MMSWNYRVLYDEGTEMFQLTEAYYDNPGDKEVAGYVADPIAPQGETKEELMWALKMMLEALDKPVLIHKPEEWLTDEEKEGGEDG